MRRLRATVLHAALWSPVALGFAFALAVNQHMAWGRALFTGIMSTIPAALLAVPVVRLCDRLPLGPTPPARLAAVHVGAALVFSALWTGAIVLEIGLGDRRAVRDFVSTGAAWQLVTATIVYALVAGIAYARNAQRRQMEQQRAAERAETSRLRAELGALRAKLEPHFLFNVLQTLGALVTDRPAQAHSALQHLASLLQRRLEPTPDGDDDVTLAAELADVRDYGALERLRLGARLQVREVVAPETLELLLPRFTLQPLIENAIRHGISPRAGGGTLTISSARDGDGWTLTVSDDGAGGETARASNGAGIGLSVVRERLRLRFGDRAGVNVEGAPGRGWTVALRLPVAHDGHEPSPAEVPA